MNTDCTDQLHEAMTSLPASVPPDLVRKVSRRYRRRRAAQWGTAVAGAAVVTAAAVIITAPAAVPVRVDARTAYVVSRVTTALESVGHNSILYARQTHRYGNQDVNYSVSTSLKDREWTVTSDGQLVSDEELSSTATTITHTVVDYREKNWSRITAVLPSESASPSPSAPSCAAGEPDGWSPDPVQEAAMLRTAMSCGQLKAAGVSLVDGVSVIELDEAAELASGSIMTFWVDATTYLPVRIVQTWSQTPSADTQMDMRWLPPTPANLAQLNLHIPAGFKQVPWS